MTTITLLTQGSCASCDQAKAALTRLADEFPLQIQEVSLESDEGRSLAAENGVLFAPGVLLDGAMFSYGRLPEKKLRKRLIEQA
ncbi:MAG TPA: thioredoxin family protein [Lacisediminihabitans sp.]|uniref:thioredoxin family protein n=1 Tax=Lacisediminihabitans sp. TaxID=2787631 RepID=UPI002ED97C06